MSVKLNSTGGGSVTLDSPSTASNYTITLPSAAGTLATTTGTGSVFTNPTINGFTGDTSAITVGTTQFVKDTSGNIGIGTASPSYKLDVAGIVRISNGGDTYIGFGANKDNYWTTGTASGKQIWRNSSGSEFLTLDSSGNLGLGVTPSASWQSGRRVLQVGGSAALWATSGSAGSLFLSNNVYFDGTNFRYLNTSGASYLAQATDGSYSFNQAPSGTAGNAISFTQAMTLDASGNLLLGTTTSNGLLLEMTSTTQQTCGITVTRSSPNIYTDIYGCGTGGTWQGNIRFFTSNNAAASERARIDSSGNLLVGATSVLGGTNKLCLLYDGSAAGGLLTQTSTNVSYTAAVFKNSSGTTVGSISCTSSTTTYVPTSDISLKENIKPITNGLERVAKLKPVDYNWKLDGVLDNGFIAQDLLATEEFAHRCNAIETKEDGTKVYGVDYMKFVAVLTAAIQELSAQNQALEARLAQLEAK